jgi:diguanylate cyclase (GGDEF)-like protein/PAS domain S-box-containing protein
MPIADIGLARTLRLIATSIAIVVAVSLPLGYWLVVHSFAADAAANDAEAHAQLVTQKINASPDLWRFETPRLDVIVATRLVHSGLPEKHYILDERGTVLAQGAESLSPPILTRSAPLLDSGTVVGQFVTSRSLVPLLQNTALVALFGLMLALAVYVSLSVLPLHALTRILGVLGQEQGRLRAIVDNAVEGIITFNLQGILQSLNPAAGRMFDYSSAEVVGRGMGDLLPEIDMAKAGLPGRQAYLGTLETVGRRKDGSSFPIELSISQAMLEGKPQMIAIAHDITERKRAEQTLHESEMRLLSLTEIKRREEELQRFRVAMDATADAIYLVDRASMRFIDVNEAACRMQNRTREELLVLGPDGVLSLSREELARTYDSVIAGGPGVEPVEMLRRRQDGTQVWVELRRRAQRLGESWMIVTVVRDITARKQAEQALRDSAEKLRLFADNVPAMTVSWDENLRCRFANKVFTEFFGLAGEDIIGKHVREVLGEEVYQELEGHFAQVLQAHPVTYQRTHKLPNGESRYIEVKLLPHIGDQGKVLGCFAVTTDITEHKLAEERIQRVAHHDSLTGLPNRLLFNDRLEQAISLAKRDSRQFALLYLDLDKFKPVNDTLGHAAGDELLKAVGARLRRQVRESDTVARVGGDEFTVILPDIARREEAETVAKKIIAAVAAPFELGSQRHSVDIGTSIGIALYPADARDADALVKAADAAMYSAKQIRSSFRFCEA